MTVRNPTGDKTVQANGKSYRLHLGMSVLGDLQEQFGDHFDALFAARETGHLPNLKVIHAIFLGALQRYHAAEADRWLVDDIMAENPNALPDLLASAFPDPKEAGKAEGKRRAVA